MLNCTELIISTRILILSEYDSSYSRVYTNIYDTCNHREDPGIAEILYNYYHIIFLLYS